MLALKRAEAVSVLAAHIAPLKCQCLMNLSSPSLSQFIRAGMDSRGIVGYKYISLPIS
jgi:hypothetical protein